MNFVGIVSNRISNKQASRILVDGINEEKYKLFFINDKNVANYKNVKFDTILIDDSLDKKISLHNILEKSEYIVINSDIKDNFDIIHDINSKVITYGFMEKSTVNISSVEDENLMISIQRGIQKKDGTIIENQEISIKKLAGINMHIVIGLAIINMIYS